MYAILWTLKGVGEYEITGYETCISYFNSDQLYVLKSGSSDLAGECQFCSAVFVFFFNLLRSFFFNMHCCFVTRPAEDRDSSLGWGTLKQQLTLYSPHSSLNTFVVSCFSNQKRVASYSQTQVQWDILFTLTVSEESSSSFRKCPTDWPLRPLACQGGVRSVALALAMCTAPTLVRKRAWARCGFGGWMFLLCPEAILSSVSHMCMQMWGVRRQIMINHSLRWSFYCYLFQMHEAHTGAYLLFLVFLGNN